MKKEIVFAGLFLICSIFIVGCTNAKLPKEKDDTSSNIEKRGVFISYIELMHYIKDKDDETSKKNIDQIINNIKHLKFNMLILQVRSFSDSIYESEIFPWSYTVSNKEGQTPEYDILQYFIEKAHENEIELHAWINPYRIRNINTKESISEKNPAYKWLGTDNVKTISTGTYYNPSSPEVEDLIVKGVKEIIDNYDVDGIHFDDYFFPGEEIDIENYNKYIKSNPDISIEKYRLDYINKMIRNVYKTIKETDKSIEFGISPEGNITNNYSKNYADVYTWGKSDEYIDYLMPQIYYGLVNEVKPFAETTKEWEEVIENKNIKVFPALAFYKVGTVDSYAKSGENEWVENDDIIMRQIILGRNLNNYEGFAIFRYDNIFNSELATSTTFGEIENMKKILN